MEKPREKGVEVSFHNHEEQRQVSAFTDAVSVGIETSADLLPAWTGVEWRRVERWCFAGNCFLLASSEVGDFPDEDSVCGVQLLQVLANAELAEMDVMETNRPGRKKKSNDI